MKNNELKRAIFPGTFDPFTIGHASVVRRALTFMDEVIIGIGVNEKKRTLLPVNIRMKMLQDYYAADSRIRVETYDDLTIDFARREDAHFIIRGIRSVKDFEYEEGIADVNRQLAGVETILLFTEPELTNISSSVVRELMSYGKDVSRFLPVGMIMPDEIKRV